MWPCAFYTWPLDLSPLRTSRCPCLLLRAPAWPGACAWPTWGPPCGRRDRSLGAGDGVGIGWGFFHVPTHFGMPPLIIPSARQEVAFYDTGDGMGALLQGLEADANDVQTAVGDKV